MVLLACSPAQQGSCRPRDKGSSQLLAVFAMASAGDCTRTACAKRRSVLVRTRGLAVTLHVRVPQ